LGVPKNASEWKCQPALIKWGFSATAERSIRIRWQGLRRYFPAAEAAGTQSQLNYAGTQFAFALSYLYPGPMAEPVDGGPGDRPMAEPALNSAGVSPLLSARA
jgi:hypothetical protein